MYKLKHQDEMLKIKHKLFLFWKVTAPLLNLLATSGISNLHAVNPTVSPAIDLSMGLSHNISHKMYEIKYIELQGKLIYIKNSVI